MVGSSVSTFPDEHSKTTMYGCLPQGFLFSLLAVPTAVSLGPLPPLSFVPDGQGNVAVAFCSILNVSAAEFASSSHSMSWSSQRSGGIRSGRLRGAASASDAHLVGRLHSAGPAAPRLRRATQTHRRYHEQPHPEPRPLRTHSPLLVRENVYHRITKVATQVKGVGPWRLNPAPCIAQPASTFLVDFRLTVSG